MRKVRIGRLLLGLALLAPTGAVAEPIQVRLSYATADTGTEIGIAWNTEAEEDTVVQYGPTTAYGFEEYGTSFLASGSLGYVHEVVLTDLEPLQTYHYRVGSYAGGWSPDYQFETAQPAWEECSYFDFAVIGDSRSESERGPSPIFHDLLEEIIGRADPAFILHGGDIVHEGEYVHEWVNELSEIEDLAPYVPLMYTIGNHDDGPVDGPGAYYNQVYQLPTNLESKTGEFVPYADVEDFYYFTYADAIFVSLSTQTYTDFAMQARWLDEVLANNPRKWKFVFFHHPIYTSDPFGVFHEPNEKGQNEYFVPIFDKYHVDIVFTSHNHFYERFEPSYGGWGDEAQPVDDFASGTVYVVTGGGGATTAPFTVCNAEGSVTCSGRNHYVSISIEGNKLEYSAWTTEVQMYGWPRGHIIDAFTILKSGPNPCQ